MITGVKQLMMICLSVMFLVLKTCCISWICTLTAFVKFGVSLVTISYISFLPLSSRDSRSTKVAPHALLFFFSSSFWTVSVAMSLIF